MFRPQRGIVFWLVCLVIVAMLTGCGAGKPAASGGEAQPKAQGNAPQSSAPQSGTKYLRLATSSVGGTFYVLGSGMAQVLNSKIPGIKVTVEPGSIIASVQLVQKKEMELALTQPETLYWGYKGEQYFDKACPDVRAILPGHITVVHFVIPKNSGIKTLADIKGKKICLAPSESGATAVIELLKQYGLQEKDYDGKRMAHNAAVQALKDKQLDAAAVFGGAPNASVIDLLSTGGYSILPVESGKLQSLHEAIPYFASTKIPAGTYKGVDTEIETLCVYSVLFTHKDQDKQLVYSITKTLCENADAIAQVHPSGKEWTLEQARKSIQLGVLSGMPFHEGAKQYLKQNGIEVE